MKLLLFVILFTIVLVVLAWRAIPEIVEMRSIATMGCVVADGARLCPTPLAN